MELSYCFCGVQLGVLTRTAKGYAYTSNLANEEKLRDHTVVRGNYNLWWSLKRESRVHFPEMEIFLTQCLRQDIQERAGISQQDSRWDKLVKLSRLHWYPAGFYLEVELHPNIQFNPCLQFFPLGCGAG
jgi:hypothetical protein